MPSNVVKMARAVRETEGQLIYYHAGVGTGDGWDRWTGGALGMGLTRNIKHAYAWIAANLGPQDTNAYQPPNLPADPRPPVSEDGLAKVEEIRRKLYGAVGP